MCAFLANIERNQELWCEKAVAVVNPRNSKDVKIGVTLRYRFDLNALPHWEVAGEYLTNDIYENPTTKERGVSHVQVIPLQTLNDIIAVSNRTKLKYHTQQRLLDPFTVERALEYAHNNRALISPEDDVFFVGNLKLVKQ